MSCRTHITLLPYLHIFKEIISKHFKQLTKWIREKKYKIIENTWYMAYQACGNTIWAVFKS